MDLVRTLHSRHRFKIKEDSSHSIGVGSKQGPVRDAGVAGRYLE